MSAGKRTGGWGAGSGEPAPFGALQQPDDDITIPKIPEGAVSLRSVAADAGEANVAPEDGPAGRQRVLPIAGGWSNPDIDD